MGNIRVNDRVLYEGITGDMVEVVGTVIAVHHNEEFPIEVMFDSWGETVRCNGGRLIPLPYDNSFTGGI
jgi:hypothetical protein